MNPSVMIGMPVGNGSVPWPTAVSLMSTTKVCVSQKIPLRVEGPVGCSVVTWARNVIVANFLKSDATHLFWIDSDIAWAPNDFLRLLGAACGPYDIIGATYALKTEPPQVIINHPDPNAVEVNGHGNVRVRSLALGFTVVKREVIEKLADGVPQIIIQGIACPDVFRLGRRDDGNAVGEDIAFFDDAAALGGYKAWLDPSVKLDHIGMKAYRSDAINALGLDEYAQEKPA